MGDYNAIYEAGQSLVELFRREITPLPIDTPEKIGLCLPQEPEDFQLTVWLYNIEHYYDTGIHSGYVLDPANPNSERYVSMQLRCHALISAHSKAPIQTRLTDEYRILGRAMQIVWDTPAIPADKLTGSLANSGTPLQLQYLKLNNDELNKIWNTASKIIKPSFAVYLSSLSIESNRTRTVSSRVSSARVDFRQKQ
ncbi:Pvc16 family protein [Desulfosporosinus sp. PR]|uniref:Pvc16 family protein n=1 Tax=Candidatus Desulfosporosinus nitrosoreducens TaxID=3401928 RepID=UPI0027ED2DB7|nr:Pvc16 family protein [Desulfosporosinus sp. PR]MDQ7096745.1 Pvc16 family protein [Desulfosporosinus sp. PR]